VKVPRFLNQFCNYPQLIVGYLPRFPVFIYAARKYFDQSGRQLDSFDQTRVQKTCSSITNNPIAMVVGLWGVL
jgi:hypothetical protein